MSIVNKRVGIDMHVLDGKFQGSRTYAIEVFSRVVKLLPEIEFYLFLDKPETLAEFSDVFDSSNVKRIRMPHSSPFKRYLKQLPAYQKKYSLDLLHTQYISPIPSYSKVIVSTHDILFESLPECFTCFFRLRSRLLMRYSAHKACKVFTLSDYSKKELIERYSVPENKIIPTPLGYNSDRFYNGKDGAQFLDKRSLDSDGYILSVGRLEPRKNHTSLLKAYYELYQNNQNLPPLVIAGQRDFKFNKIFELLNEMDISDKVKILEDVSDEELPALFRHAQIFVYPSYGEGFGLPVLEAMASGVPVVTSNRTSLPEVIGDSGIQIDPDNINELAEAMEKLLRDKSLRHVLKQRGLKRSATFSWDSVAEKIVCEYKTVLED